MFNMRRREFITLVGGTAVAWPLAARAQTKRMRRIGVLTFRKNSLMTYVAPTFISSAPAWLDIRNKRSWIGAQPANALA